MKKNEESLKSRYIIVEGNQIYKIRYIYIFLCYLILAFCIYGPLCNKHFSNDSYMLYFTKARGSFIWNGRIIPYLFSLIYNKLNLNIIDIQFLTTFISIICVASLSFLLFLIFYSKLKNRNVLTSVILFLSCLFITVNFIILEWFLYPEVTMFYIVGMILAVLSAKICAEAKTNVKKYILGMILALSSMYMYQININIYIIVVSILIGMNNEFKINRKSIKELSLAIILGVITAIMSLATNSLIKVLYPNVDFRESGFSINSLIDNIIYIVKAQKLIFVDGINLMRSSWMLYFLVVMVGGIFYILIKNRRESIFFIAVVLIINFVVIYNPNYFLSTDLWLSPRVLVALPYFLGMLPIIVLYINNDENKLKYNIITLIMIIMLTVPNIITTQNVITDHFVSNKLDREYALLINNEIKKYEKESNIQIKNIAPIMDTAPTYKYSCINNANFDTNARGYVLEWADVTMINYYCGENYNRADMKDEIFKKYFKDKNWDYFNPKEQFIFDGDTLYWCIY